ncbi:hypothetical protein [Bradyrhizobium erythrophlei]|uniref:hypothetical protein n=1 Tax=Bradyrhizobium erythrophlei TaxID=1437360 RepID=UPI003CC7FBA2
MAKRHPPTLPLMLPVVNARSNASPDVIDVAAGGIADGRVLTAAHMLDAQEVLIDGRFWATQEPHPSQRKGQGGGRFGRRERLRYLSWRYGYFF